MKRTITKKGQISRAFFLLTLIICAAFAAAHAQLPPNGTVIPTVCFESKPETLTRTLTNNLSAGSVSSAANPNGLQINQGVLPGFYTLVFDPGGARQETLVGRVDSQNFQVHLSASGIPGGQVYQFAHPAGETIYLITAGDAVYGYNNTSGTAVTIPRGVSQGNYFAPGALINVTQPSLFQPGVNENMMRLKVIPNLALPTWFLNGGEATPNLNANCATITYQGRLSDGGSAANGQFDLQFQAFDAATVGATQSGLITLENVPVTNGIFTVPLFFGASFTNNFNARFLQIGVRPGTSTDAFTVLTPRQPITQVPYAINAQTALTALNATNAATATTATNAVQLGGVPAAGYLTTGSNFGQSVTTANATGSLLIDAASGNYTLIPGLTQTINVPANSVLLISTDGGIISTGALNSFSVVDVAVFVDGASIAQRRIVIGNFPLPASVGNWALSLGQTLAPGSRTIEIRARNGFGGSANSNVSSGSDPLLRGQLTVAVIKK